MAGFMRGDNSPGARKNKKRGYTDSSPFQRLYRGLMICHRELGDHSEVLQVYRRCREYLNRMLGVQPNSKTQAIYQSVRQESAAA